MSVILWCACHLFRRLMGCATSGLAGFQRTTPDSDQKNDEQELAKFTAPPPKIYIKVGNGVQKYVENKATVLFIFGGPGSMKGTIIEELVSTFNFTVISTEDIVLNYLPNKVANTVQTTQEIKELLTTEPGLLTLDWVLHLISAKIATSSQRFFLIDIVPNLISLLRVETFSKPDVSKEMIGFEKKHPCLFAINLIVPEMNVMDNSANLSMKMNNKTAQKEEEEEEARENEKENGEKGKDKAKEKEDKKEKEKKSVFTEGSDEMDNTRLKKRFDLYITCAKPFLDYFDENERTIMVDVPSQHKEFVWKRLYDVLRDYSFSTKGSNRTLVLFVTNEEQILGLDVLYYKMLKVSLSAIVSNRSDSLEQMIKAVHLYVKRSATNQNHLFILDTLNPKCDVQVRRINFLEVRECYLDRFVKQKSSSSKGKPFKKPFKSVTSTSNEICLFPGEMDTDLCKKIAMCYALAENPSLATAIDETPKFVDENNVTSDTKVITPTENSNITNIS